MTRRCVEAGRPSLAGSIPISIVGSMVADAATIRPFLLRNQDAKA